MSEQTAGTSAGRILVVDDEPQLLRAMRSVLVQRGFDFAGAASGEEALEHIARSAPDLVVLDLSLPGISGLEVCRTVREFSAVPILILSVRDGEADKIAALELGADDYLTKPFSTGELVARIRALLRRAQAISQHRSAVVAGDITVDLKARTVQKRGLDAGLTRTEFDILAALAKEQGRVVLTQAILDEVWGKSGGKGTEALRVHVSHLRAKIEDDPSRPRRVVTEPGVGYRLSIGDGGFS